MSNNRDLQNAGQESLNILKMKTKVILNLWSPKFLIMVCRYEPQRFTKELSSIVGGTSNVSSETNPRLYVLNQWRWDRENVSMTYRNSLRWKIILFIKFCILAFVFMLSFQILI